MFVDFTFKNSYSFKDENYFSMECSSEKSYVNINTFNSRYKNIELLKSSLIYGANASGKSNLVKTINSMKNAVLYSAMPVSLKGISGYKFIDKSFPTEFEINIVINGIKYRYGFKVLNSVIEGEWLYRTKEREICLFKRTSSSYEDINLYSSFKSAKNIKPMVSENTLFITICKMLNYKEGSVIWEWFYNLEVITISQQESMVETFRLLDENPNLKNDILEYLKKADIDIEDFSYEIKTEDSDIGKKIGEMNIGVQKMKISNFNTKHKVYDENGEHSDKMVELPFENYQSDGTKKLFSIIGPIFNSLKKGKIIIIDEIDARFHPQMVRVILNMFNSININIQNSQLICTTHDVLLLEENIRKDQVWFIDKSEKGISELYSLSDFNGIRKEDNILKKYLLGMFGALPFEKGIELLWQEK